MASIDAFRELTEHRRPVQSTVQASRHGLELAERRPTGWKSYRERGLILLAVGLWHVGILIALRAAMHVSPTTHREVDQPLQITIIDRHVAPILPQPPALPRLHHPNALAPRRSIPRSDALQAVAIEHQPKPTDTEPPKALIYAPDSAMQLPPAQTAPPSRDLLAHRSMSSMLPGSDRPLAPGLHVHAGVSPQKVVERVGMLFGGGPVDPCPELETDLVNTADPDARERAMERFERSCPGR
ncbi:MAG: hypothetical protein ABI365_04805 [Lysobacteraceae bacterium]